MKNITQIIIIVNSIIAMRIIERGRIRTVLEIVSTFSSTLTDQETLNKPKSGVSAHSSVTANSASGITITLGLLSGV